MNDASAFPRPCEGAPGYVLRGPVPSAPPDAVAARPGFAPLRLKALIREAVQRTGLDLRGLTVLTEAATGAYGTTPVIAAMAGARVHALARASRHGSVEQIRDRVGALALQAGVADRIAVVETVPPDLWRAADIVTNSGHLRPIDAAAVAAMRSDAVIALMFEAWEFRAADIDLAACRAKGVRIVGVNERHESIDVFSYLGLTCVKMLFDAGISVYGSRIALLCDNDFGPFIMRGLTGLGARVQVFDGVGALPADSWQAVVCALRPTRRPRIGPGDAKRLARVAPQAVLAQFWGDVDRRALREAGVALWPEIEPAPGHMAALLDATGPEAVVRLQTGGLLAARRVFRGEAAVRDPVAQLL